MTNVIENSGAQLGYLILEQDGQWMIAAQADVDEMEAQIEKSIPIAESDLLAWGIVHYVARTQENVVLEDASQSGEFVQDPYLQRNEAKSLLCTPLVNQGKTSAILYLENNLSTGIFTPGRVELLKLLSSQMAISIDNARTHVQLEKLLQERSTALNTAEEQINTLFESAQVGIGLANLDGKILSVNKALLNMTGFEENEILQRNVIDLYMEPEQRTQLVEQLQESNAVRNFGAKILRKDGSFFYASLNVSKLTRDGQEVILALIEDVSERVNAEKLLEQAAAQVERDRLARDLHDSVTQGIYSASLIAETLPMTWEQDPEKGRHRLKQLERFTKGALAEMRTLLLEMNPTALTGQELPILVRQLADSMMARTNTSISTTIIGDCIMPVDVKLALYRITQEALNNVAKHAQASHASINLQDDGSLISLRIRDDGRGFDPGDAKSHGLGIGIMKARVEDIGAELSITTQRDQGTEVFVQWSSEGQS